jgi:FtsZ-binding cell division protein ZapB
MDNDKEKKYQEIIAAKDQTITQLKKDIDRLQEEFDNFKIINADHQKLNGELRIEVNKLKKENESFKDPLNKLRKDGNL